MRLKKEEVSNRENFLVELVKQDPTVTIRAAQEKIKEKFGRQMRPHRILEIKDAVKDAVKAGTPVVLPTKKTARKVATSEQEAEAAGQAAGAVTAVPGQQEAV